MYSTVMLFLFGLVLLIKGGDWFVEGATALARRFRIPDLLIGATVVSIGTTLPEVMVSATSAVGGHGEIAYGNAIGSIICNTALIAALTVAVTPCTVRRSTLRTPVCFFFAAAVFYAAVAYFAGYFYRWVGIALLALFVVYMAVNVWQMRRASAIGTLGGIGGIDCKPTGGKKTGCAGGAAAGSRSATGTVSDAPADGAAGERPLWQSILRLVGGAALIALGADLLVDNGVVLAGALGVPESVIGITFVAVGTSLPELVTAVTSLIKRHGALSLGNIIGANLFNLVLVSGIATTLAPFPVPVGQTIGGVSLSLVLEIPLMFFVMLFLTVPALVRGKLARMQGIVLLALYAAFCVLQFTL